MGTIFLNWNPVARGHSSVRTKILVSSKVYQNLGFIKGDKLVILSPQLKVESFQVSGNNDQVKTKADRELVNEAIAWYQTASYSFAHGLLR